MRHVVVGDEQDLPPGPGRARHCGCARRRWVASRCTVTSRRAASAIERRDDAQVGSRPPAPAPGSRARAPAGQAAGSRPRTRAPRVETATVRLGGAAGMAFRGLRPPPAAAKAVELARGSARSSAGASAGGSGAKRVAPKRRSRLSSMVRNSCAVFGSARAAIAAASSSSSRLKEARDFAAGKLAEVDAVAGAAGRGHHRLGDAPDAAAERRPRTAAPSPGRCAAARPSQPKSRA